MITEAEEKLLNLLKENVRASISELAAKLKISRATVQVRMAKLERLGVIKAYTLELGESYIENFISAHVAIATEQAKAIQVSSKLLKISEVTEVHSINGEYDLIAIVKTKTTEILDNILYEIAKVDGVVRTNSSIILATKQRR